MELRSFDFEVGIPNSYDLTDNRSWRDQPAGRQGCRATGIPRRQAGLANREAILPSGEPIIRSFVENRSELRYNTSQKTLLHTKS
ncbi:TPA: hypothetical protein DIU27_01350 [Candidatus Collierbacteria bacterium]|nr:hypothetical protein [Candidatus Collierbacteria bacterium]